MMEKTFDFGQNKAFTLAEVLITLGIIGVVAALTIPALLNRTNDLEYKVGLKKAYSDIVQATTLLETRDGIDFPTFNNDCNNLMNLYNKVLPGGTCGKASSCFTDSGETGSILVNNGGGAAAWSVIYGNNSFTYYFANTANIAGDVVATIGGSTFGNMFSIAVDVNGNKKPNKLGVDSFLFFVLNKNGKALILPAGSNVLNGNYSYANSPCSSQKTNCTAYYLDNN